MSVTLLIGGSTTTDINETLNLPDPGCADWIDGLDPGNATVTLQARVSGDIRRRDDDGDDSAEVRAERIVRLDIGGNLNKVYVRHQSTTADLSAIVVGGQIVNIMTSDSTAHSIQSAGGRIVLVQAVGNIRAPIIVQNSGTIGQIVSTAGDIGGARPPNSAGTSTSGYNATNISAGTIDLIRGNSVRADITATIGIREMEATVEGFRGSLVTPTILNIGSAGGYLKTKMGSDMSITLTDGLPANAKIIFGAYFGFPVTPSLKPRITIEGPDRLKGQIIVNDFNNTAPYEYEPELTTNPTFFGDLVIENSGGSGTTTITDPIYAPNSLSLGGGAMGLVPYRFYGSDCDPAPNVVGLHDGKRETEFVTTATPAARPVAVTIGHYGPIKRGTGYSTWNATVEFDCQPLNMNHTPVCAEWTPVGGLFDVVGPGDAGWTNPRAIGIKAKPDVFPRSGYYRVRLANTAAIVCDGTSLSSPPGVLWANDPFCSSSPTPSYTFRIRGDCDKDNTADDEDTSLDCVANCGVIDFNDSETITVQDLFDFLAAYFAGCHGQPGSPCNGHSADVNGSGQITVQDIFDFLAEFFTCII